MKIGAKGYVIAEDAVRLFRCSAKPTRTRLEAAQAGSRGVPVALNLPDVLGLYALVLERADGRRTALGTIARVHRPTPRKDAIPQVMLEGGFGEHHSRNLRHPGDAEEVAAIIKRLGATFVRLELHSSEQQPGRYDWTEFDAALGACERHGIKLRDNGEYLVFTAYVAEGRFNMYRWQPPPPR